MDGDSPSAATLTVSRCGVRPQDNDSCNSLGIAIVGTVVTGSVSGDLVKHLPTTTASKLALSAALQHGFLAVLVFALITLVATFFLKEKLIAATQGALSPERAPQADEESDKELVLA